MGLGATFRNLDNPAIGLDSATIAGGVHNPGGLSERPMEPVLKTGGQKCLVGSNPTPSAY